ncbi:MAG: hypothetical protein COB84_10070 [Rhodobacteraceae bacterium]|nr:MAG: hypothetical protein COB84_10070 [Paracoccaceae bacterium]
MRVLNFTIPLNRYNGIRLALFTLSTLFLNPNLLAQHPQPIFKHYTVEDGLSSSEVHHVMQDSKGYMWFATDMGVSRFDGYDFQNFSFQEGLPDNTIFNIYEDCKERIWFVSFSGRLSLFEDEEVVAYKYSNVLEDAVVNLFKGSFYVDREDMVYVRVGLQGFITIDKEGELRSYHLDSANTSGIIYLDGGEIFSYTGNLGNGINNLKIIKEGDTTFISVDQISSRTNFNCIEVQSNKLLFAAGRTACLISPNLTSETHTISHDVLSTFEDLEKDLWIGTYQGGVLFYKNGLIGDNPMRYLEGLSITGILQDYEGGFWFTTLESGVYYLSSKYFLSYTKANGLNGDKVTCLASDSGNTLFAGLRNGTFFTITDSIISKQELSMSVTPSVQTLYFDQNTSKLWVGSPGSDLIIDGNKIGIIPGIGGSHHIIQSADGSIWMGNHSSLRRLIDEQIVLTTDKTKNPFRVTALYQGKQGKLWLGNLQGLWTFKDGAFTPAYQSDSLLRYRVSDIDELNGDLCIATKGAGLIIRHNGSMVQLITESSLSSDNINDIFIDGTNIWLSTNNGVNKIQLNFQDPLSSQVTIYNTSHGLASNEVNQVIKFKDKIWAATNRGLSIFDDYANNSSQSGPNIYIKGVSISESDTNILSSYELPYDQNQITIRYLGLSYRSVGQTEYRVKMKGIDSSWVYTQNTSIRYTTIPPGSYSFEVAAKNSSGQWSPEPATFKLIIRPPFWKTWWFTLAIILLAFTIVYLFFRIRILTYNRDVVRELMIEILNKFRPAEYLVERIGSSTVSINTRSILWIKAADNYVEIVTKDKTYLVRSTLDQMFQKLPNKLSFLKIHRSYIIQLSKVKSVEKNAVNINDKRIPVSDSYNRHLNIIKEHLLLRKK